MQIIWFKIFVAFFPVMIFVFILHIRSYRQLYESLKMRKKQVAGLEIEFWDYGSGGCIRKIQTILSQFGDSELSNFEKRLITKSKVYYNLGKVGVVIFLIGIVSMFLNMVS